MVLAIKELLYNCDLTIPTLISMYWWCRRVSTILSPQSPLTYLNREFHKLQSLTLVHKFRVKFWNVAYLEEMDYDKTKKPLVLPKSMVRSKSKKLAAAREVEHQLPSSGRANKAEFFQGLKPE